MDSIASPAEMRRVLGSFASGVVVVTGDHRGSPVGITCQSFASLSLDPPLVLFCPAQTSSSWPRIEASGRFVVNVLASDQRALSDRFSTRRSDKFADLDWEQTPWGPCLPGSLATVLCSVEAVHPGGDHHIVVGRVEQLVAHRDDDPLVFFRGAFGLTSGAG